MLFEQIREFQPAWIMAYRRAFKYLGGVPGPWFIDNFKAGVDKPGHEKPRLNPRFRDSASSPRIMADRRARQTYDDRAFT